MKFSTSLLVAAAAALVSAQVTYDNSTGTWTCPVANGAYCNGDSLSTSMIILCTDGVGVEGNCDGHAQSRPPIDVYYAPCYQVSDTAGNASCSKNCTVYPDEGDPFSVPAAAGCAYQSASYGSDIAGWDFGTNVTITPNGTYVNTTTTNTSSSAKAPTATASKSSANALLVNTGASIVSCALAAVLVYAL